MSLEKATKILQDCELDRMTKLDVINLMTLSKDPAMVQDLVNLIIEWDTADNQEEEEFLLKMKEIESKYQKEVSQKEADAVEVLNDVKEEVESADKVQGLKEQIAGSE
jgi:hypothetical protein